MIEFKKWTSWFDTNSIEQLNLVIIFLLRNFATLVALLSLKGAASTHFVAEFVATKMYLAHVLLPLGLIGLTKSRSQFQKGSSGKIGWSCIQSIWVGCSICWHQTCSLAYVWAFVKFSNGHHKCACIIFHPMVALEKFMPAAWKWASYSIAFYSSSKTHIQMIWSAPLLNKDPIMIIKGLLFRENFFFLFVVVIQKVTPHLLKNCNIWSYQLSNAWPSLQNNFVFSKCSY